MAPSLNNFRRTFNLDRLNLDSNVGVFFQRELEALDLNPYTDLLPGTKAIDYFPMKPGVPEWADSVAWKQFTQRGHTRKGSKNATNLPRVSLTATPKSRRIEQFPLSYGWSRREIEQAAATGVPLEQLTVMTAQMAARQFIDSMLARGDGGDITGALKGDANIAVLTALTKTSGTVWTTATNTPDQCLADFTYVLGELMDGLKQTDSPQFDKFTVLVPTKKYTYLSTTPRSDHTDTTLLQFILKNYSEIEAVEPWWQCDAAAANDTSDRMLIYARNPMCVQAIVPTLFRPVSPQEIGLDIIVPCTASSGGITWIQPVAARYLDGI